MKILKTILPTMLLVFAAALPAQASNCSFYADIDVSGRDAKYQKAKDQIIQALLQKGYKQASAKDAKFRLGTVVSVEQSGGQGGVTEYLGYVSDMFAETQFKKMDVSVYMASCKLAPNGIIHRLPFYQKSSSQRTVIGSVEEAQYLKTIAKASKAFINSIPKCSEAQRLSAKTVQKVSKDRPYKLDLVSSCADQ